MKIRAIALVALAVLLPLTAAACGKSDSGSGSGGGAGSEAPALKDLSAKLQQGGMKKEQADCVAKAFADAIHGRPLYCLSPLVLDWIGKPAQDRYLNYVDASCRAAEDPMLRPAEAIIQNQLFTKEPL